MRRFIFLIIIILTLLLSGCATNTPTSCVDNCLEKWCRDFEGASDSRLTQCIQEMKKSYSTQSFVTQCQEQCGVIEKKEVGCKDYSPNLIFNSINKTEDEIIEARNNYNVELIEFQDEGTGYCFNTNNQKRMSSSWTMLKLNITNNNDFALNILTVKISHSASYGRLAVPVNDIKAKDTKEVIVHFPVKISSYSDIEVSIENDLDSSTKSLLKELK